MASAKEQLIVDVWRQTGRESVGAAELELIQSALGERFGADAQESPAWIARTLADHGARLEHPQILEADVRWRERDVFALFSPDELNFTTLETATTLVEKVEALHHRFAQEKDQPAVEQLRKLVLQLKVELQLMAVSKHMPRSERDVATEVTQWFAIWLQNPAIFADWLSLRRQSAEFLDRFGPRKGT